MYSKLECTGKRKKSTGMDSHGMEFSIKKRCFALEVTIPQHKELRYMEKTGLIYNKLLNFQYGTYEFIKIVYNFT
jgi:hypothetical protein